MEPTAGRTLVGLLADEHAAIAAYAVLGARLGDSERATARSAYDAHRSARDALQVLLPARGLEAPGPLPAYDVSAATRAAALALAVRVEEQLSVRWRDLVAQTDDVDLRKVAVQQLSACAVRGSGWRRLAGLAPTVPLPGEA